jgi:hypothetical protein
VTIVDVAFGSKADIAGGLIYVRFTPESGHRREPSSCPLCAKSGRFPVQIAIISRLSSPGIRRDPPRFIA